MKVLIVVPDKEAYEAKIGNGLKDMQKVVGGYIQAIYPYEEPVAIVCNEEGKMNGLPLNRALRDEDGNVYDIIAGTFFICGLSEDNFGSLPPELMEQFLLKFKNPQLFFRDGDGIVVVDTAL